MLKETGKNLLGELIRLLNDEAITRLIPTYYIVKFWVLTGMKPKVTYINDVVGFD